MQISLDASGGFRLSWPSGHHVSIPADERGVRCLRRILLAQRVNATNSFASDAAPVQHMIDRWLVEDKAKSEAKHVELIASLEFDL